MSRIILATNPSDDAPTEYLNSWFRKIVDLARKQKDTVIFELKNDKANRMEMTELIQKEKPHLVILNGHGNERAITGYRQEILIQCNDNEDLLKEKIIHSMACDSAKELGPKCIIAGAYSFIGYKEKFHLVHLNKKSEAEQANDHIAKFFIEPAYEVMVALIEGKTAKEAYTISQERYRENLRFLITSTNSQYNTVIASRVYHNLIHQVCLGDGNAKF